MRKIICFAFTAQVSSTLVWRFFWQKCFNWYWKRDRPQFHNNFFHEKAFFFEVFYLFLLHMKPVTCNYTKNNGAAESPHQIHLTVSSVTFWYAPIFHHLAFFFDGIFCFCCTWSQLHVIILTTVALWNHSIKFIRSLRCNILICSHFPLHIRGTHKWFTHLCTPLGCAVHYLACIAQAMGQAGVCLYIYTWRGSGILCKSECHSGVQKWLNIDLLFL